jgi:hypothetical protein
MNSSTTLTLEEALESVYSGYAVQSQRTEYTLYKLGGSVPADRVLYEVLGQVDGDDLYRKLKVDVSDNDKLIILHSVYHGAFVLPGNLAKKILKDETTGWTLLKDSK